MRSSTPSANRRKLRDLCLFALLGGVMFLTKTAMQFLPNIHPLALLIAAFTLTYRTRALVPLYVYIMVDGAVYGFTPWWLPYLYVWLPLWGAFMLAGRFAEGLPQRGKIPLYCLLCGLHGLSFGLLYAPAQAVLFGLDFRGTAAWVAAGLPYDALHAAGSAAAGVLVVPLTAALRKLERMEAR